ncbi:unnamed protein product [Somion occarium]|uniref:Small ribosomal subunit protein mS29 n=1 Tax=Somion occarium TaxID=3059160 RepID=A0ABP1E782_9APHY
MLSLASRSLPAGSALASASRNGTVQSVQVRGYAAPKGPAKIQKQGFVNKGKKKKFIQTVDPNKMKRIPAFKPLTANQLKSEIFHEDVKTELQLPVFRPDALTESNALAKVMEFPTQSNLINRFGVPKNLNIEYRILSKSCAVVRDITLTALDKLDAASASSSKDNRVVLTGSSGCGKSVVLLQAAEYCAGRGWIVMYVPRVHHTVDSSTAYIYDSRTRTYLQPRFSWQVLRRFLDVNTTLLQDLKTTKEFPVERKAPVQAGSPLTDLINVGLQDGSLAPSVLSSLMTELSRQKTYPVLLALDNFQALYTRTTRYRDPKFEAIKPYHLSVPRLFLEYASGKKTFARGAVVGALSEGRADFVTPLELCEALGLPFPRPAGPYVRRVPEIVDYSQGLQKLAVPEKLSIDEAASLFDVWNTDKALHSLPDDDLFMSKYSEASGNARAFVWKGLLATLTS